MITSIAPGIPLVCDADTGFGAPAQVARTVTRYVRFLFAVAFVAMGSVSHTNANSPLGYPSIVPVWLACILKTNLWLNVVVIFLASNWSPQINSFW